MNILFSSVFLFLQLSVANYSTINFLAPLRIPLHLSGNFGELRCNHFHSGIDIKTNGKIGYRVYSIDDGYVSRIKVSASGYGNALYITHYNGFTSVYAHLHRFNIQIEDYLRSIQYKKHKFEVDVYPKRDLINITKGEVIGVSGNSGGSMGPHLHFEIRETNSEMPVNPLLFSFAVKDNISPVFSSFYVYSHYNKFKMHPVHKDGSKYVLKNDTLNVSDSVYFGVKVNDFLNGSRNKCGIYCLKLFVNNKLKYEYLVDKLSFFEQRNVLSHMDYGLSEKGIRIHRCFVDPNNTSSTNKLAVNSGKVFVGTDSVKIVRIVASDVNNNKSVLQFYIKGLPFSSIRNNVMDEDLLYWNKANSFVKNGVEFYFPKNTFFNDVNFSFNKHISSSFCGYNYSIGNLDIPVKGYFSMKIPLPNIQSKYFDKLYVAKVKKKEMGCVCAKIKVKDSIAHFKLREFGVFTILADTVSPVIKFVNVGQGVSIAKQNQILIKIVDNETGLKTYNCFVDGKWLLFEYDKKRDLLRYSFDEFFPKEVNHILSVVVVDKVGNTCEKSINFSLK